jgi:hypothetical protein
MKKMGQQQFELSARFAAGHPLSISAFRDFDIQGYAVAFMTNTMESRKPKKIPSLTPMKNVQKNVTTMTAQSCLSTLYAALISSKSIREATDTLITAPRMAIGI